MPVVFHFLLHFASQSVFCALPLPPLFTFSLHHPFPPTYPSIPCVCIPSTSLLSPPFLVLFCTYFPVTLLILLSSNHSISSVQSICSDIPEDEAQYWTSKLERINTMRIHDEVSFLKKSISF